VRAVQASILALRSWTVRQRIAAVGFSVTFALLIGIPTVLIPNPVSAARAGLRVELPGLDRIVGPCRDAGRDLYPWDPRHRRVEEN
jgi:hypothetical protein